MDLLESVSAIGSREAMFQALDGQDCEIDGHVGQMAVYGIHDDGCCLWVQVAVDGEEPIMVTFKRCSAHNGEIEFVSEALRTKAA